MIAKKHGFYSISGRELSLEQLSVQQAAEVGLSKVVVATLLAKGEEEKYFPVEIATASSILRRGQLAQQLRAARRSSVRWRFI